MMIIFILDSSADYYYFISFTNNKSIVVHVMRNVESLNNDCFVPD